MAETMVETPLEAVAAMEGAYLVVVSERDVGVKGTRYSLEVEIE